MNYQGSFGGWLKQRRKALDLTQAELADQVGCTVTTIQKLEADLRRPSKQISERLVDVLAISDDDRATFIAFARHVVDHPVSPTIQLTPTIPASNLPTQSTPFLGREYELTQIANRLADPNCRLLTLVGVGGIGKTRLVVQAAADRVEDFTDGVYFVSLAPVGEPTLIAAAIASALQLSFYGQQDPNLQVVNYLLGKHILLIMDNYEHLLPEIALVNDLLANAPKLKILVTSRERLNLSEEWVLPVEGLPFPTQSTDEKFSSYTSVRLFEQTARRLQPGFSLEGNQNSIIDICRTVEGMPLGIELAVSWLRAMPCDQIARQIKRDLDFLTTPLRDIPDRHRSLRAVFEHSWGLLSEAERSVLMKLSVFRGGIDPEAAEYIAKAPLWLLASLVDKSLVRVNTSGRFELHELLRQFAADKLIEAGEMAQTELHHFQYFLNVAEQLDQWFFGPKHLVWMDRLETEHDNLRTALDWAWRSGEIELGLRMAVALGWFWNRRAYMREGCDWLEKFLAARNDVPIPLRAKTIHHLLELSIEMGGLQQGDALYEEGRELVQEVQDPRIRGWLLCSLGFAATLRSEFHRAFLDEAFALFKKLGDQWGICETLVRLAHNALCQDNNERALVLLDQGISLARIVHDKSVLSWMLYWQGFVNQKRRGFDFQVEHIYRESLNLFRELRYKNGIQWAEFDLAEFALQRGDIVQARTLFENSLRMGQQTGNRIFIVSSLIDLAKIFSLNGEPERGIRLLGSVKALDPLLFPDLNEFDMETYLNDVRSLAVRDHLDEAAFDVAFAQGQMMTLDQAVAYALANADIVPVYQEIDH